MKKKDKILENEFFVNWLREHDEGDNKTRKLFIKAKKAFLYAVSVDMRPRDDTRKASINEGVSYKYAFCVDKCPKDDTRAGCIKDGRFVDLKTYCYFEYIDKLYD